MRQHDLKRLMIIGGAFVFGLISCEEKEDMVAPKETCSTMATVQYQQAAGLKLVLENGQVLRPENVKQLSAEKKVFAIDGFSVKAGQQVLIGYKTIPADATANGTESVKVDCIVGLSPQ